MKRLWLRPSNSSPEWTLLEQVLKEFGETIIDDWDEARQFLDDPSGIMAWSYLPSSDRSDPKMVTQRYRGQRKVFAICQTDWPDWAENHPDVERIG